MGNVQTSAPIAPTPPPGASSGAPPEVYTIEGQKYVIVPDGMKRMAEDREKSGLKGWNLSLKDDKGQRRTAFVRGPTTPDELIAAAMITFRNWQLLDFERAKTSAPPLTRRPVPARAHNFGVLESLSRLRKR